MRNPKRPVATGESRSDRRPTRRHTIPAHRRGVLAYRSPVALPTIMTRDVASTVRGGGDPQLTRHRLHRLLLWCIDSQCPVPACGGVTVGGRHHRGTCGAAADTLTVSERKSRRKAKATKGYAAQVERFQKLRGVQHRCAELAATGPLAGYIWWKAASGSPPCASILATLVCPKVSGESAGAHHGMQAGQRLPRGIPLGCACDARPGTRRRAAGDIVSISSRCG